MKPNEHTAATQKQKEGHWLAMTPKHTWYPVPTEKMDKVERDRAKYTGRKSPEDVEYYRLRDERVSALLMTGMDRGEAFKKMMRAKQLTHKGFTISLGRFRTMCCLLAKGLVIPKKETQQSAVARLTLDGLNRAEIAAILNMHVRNVDNAIIRARNKAAK